MNSTRGFIDEVQATDFYTTESGIMKKRTYRDGRVDEHPLIFPNILRQGYGMQIRVPIDDAHTREEIEKVQHGQDPMGVYRGAADLIVDTNFEESVKAEGSTVPALVFVR